MVLNLYGTVEEPSNQKWLQTYSVLIFMFFDLLRPIGKVLCWNWCPNSYRNQSWNEWRIRWNSIDSHFDSSRGRRRACTLLPSQAEQAAKSVHVPAGMRDFSTDGWGYQILDFSLFYNKRFCYLPPIFSLSLKIYFSTFFSFATNNIYWSENFGWTKSVSNE